MANEEHLSILKQGVDVWNQWRKEQREIRPDLSGANLRYADLSGANLSYANLSYADFNEADLIGANLIGVALFSATLFSATLRDVDLRDADLNFAKLSGADLSGANLGGADLSHANLNRVNLSGADLSGANLGGADLNRVNLSGADLSGANLGGADLIQADINEAQIGFTSFDNVDLTEVNGLDNVAHHGPSYIDIHTIYKSKGNIPEAFLRGAGVPDTFITYMKSLTGAAFDFYSCFISHSSQDTPFVERLYADLQAKGVRCWYAPEDLKIGEPFLLGIEQGIRLHDKLLLVLSEHSVASGWVQHEVLSAMAKEQGKAPWVLFPIRVDDAVMNTDVPWATMIKQSRHIGDFTSWKDHDAYQKAFDRLLRDLKAQG